MDNLKFKKKGQNRESFQDKSWAASINGIYD